MAITRVTNQSYGQRLGNSLKGALVGFFLFIAAFVVLFWNEGNFVKTKKSLNEGAKVVVSVESAQVDPNNNGLLVHTTGKAETGDILNDDDFRVSQNAIALKRTVEMYQWKENSKSETRDKIGGGSETVTTYTYEKIWSTSPINSSDFEDPGYTNPTNWRYDQKEDYASNVNVGGYTLSQSLIQKLNNYESLRVADSTNLVGNNMHLNNGGIYVGYDPGYAEIGDLKITWQYIPQGGDVSLIAKQMNSTFEAYHAKKGGKAIEMIEPGIKSAETMFIEAQKANKTMTWILRLVGFFMMFIGLAMMLSPLKAAGMVLPFLGNMVGFATGLVAGVVAFVLSIITIAIAWFTYRPIIAIILIAIGVGAFVWLRMQKKKDVPQVQVQKPEQQAPTSGGSGGPAGS